MSIGNASIFYRSLD